ncbi:hypothetical protein Hamer_G011574 [Homarus americanus]|uniref:Uncharacterized protein n=1 Tax=Homarus americanus TaxID=6706 RepID=A0A8J5K2W2_HOMAM|nr:hypothetical protein Hamer_G011574 [Homarus americanus]
MWSTELATIVCGHRAGATIVCGHRAADIVCGLQSWCHYSMWSAELVPLWYVVYRAGATIIGQPSNTPLLAKSFSVVGGDVASCHLMVVVVPQSSGGGASVICWWWSPVVRSHLVVVVTWWWCLSHLLVPQSSGGGGHLVVVPQSSVGGGHLVVVPQSFGVVVTWWCHLVVVPSVICWWPQSSGGRSPGWAQLVGCPVIWWMVTCGGASVIWWWWSTGGGASVICWWRSPGGGA